MVDVDAELLHYGILRRSGRYPWGSGETPQERYRGFLGYVDDLKKKGLSDAEIAKGLDTPGLTSTHIRAAKAIASNEIRKADAAQALRLKEKNMSNVAIGRRMGIPESSVRSLLDPALAEKRNILETTANMLKEHMGDGYLDIGEGTENHLGITKTKLSTAVAMLREEGYEVRNIQVPQLGISGQKTTIKTLVPPNAPKFIDPTKIRTAATYSEDGGRSYTEIVPPRNVDSKRIAVRYKEEGGANADGVIYLRRGVDDISLGASRYAQVRIAVDGTHYLKGMAMYKDDMPPGVDLIFNTNKSDTGNKLDAMKKVKGDPSDPNPFGAVVRQRHYIDSKGQRQLSALNIVNEEGDWSDWSSSLSSQFLSKQSTELAKKQLDKVVESTKSDLEDIRGLTNPVVKKLLLEKLADSADSAAVHLKAAPLPGQGTHAILPFENMKETEIYAPKYRDGTRVALVRFPHGGTFEIPELTVNNKNIEARKALSDARGSAFDAVGIHPKVAERLSGADFDGDTVLVIPNNDRSVKSTAPLAGLQNFDPKIMYAPYDGMTTIDGGVYNAATRSVDYGNKQPSGKAKQTQMGEVSNLITDMTIKGAKPEEIAAAVRHSMVVIDAEKHHLNVKQSYRDNGIASLKERYQGLGPTGRLAGASTLISRAGSDVRVPKRKLRSMRNGGPIDPETGERKYEVTAVPYTNKQGKTVIPTDHSKKLAETTDAHTLTSGPPATPIENIYADHSNSLKSLANEARKEAYFTRGLIYSPSAAKVYAPQVATLNTKLNLALKNKPLERQAQIVANSIVAARLQDNPGMENADLKKIKSQALETARSRLGVKTREEREITITPEEWKAIQAGAISSHKLSDILDHANIDKVRELATPREVRGLSPSRLALAKARLASGYTEAQVADSLGISPSTLIKAIRAEGATSG